MGSWTLLSQGNGTKLHHYLNHLGLHYQLPLVTCYLLGGIIEGYHSSKKVFSVCLDDLISQAISQQPASASAPPTPSPWQSLPDTPQDNSTALTFNGALLAVGGDYPGSTAIYHYQLSSRSWIKAGSCLLSDVNVPVQFSPVGTCMWLVDVVLINKWT